MMITTDETGLPAPDMETFREQIQRARQEDRYWLYVGVPWVEALFAERDAARAEVERLKLLLSRLGPRPCTIIG